MASKGYTIQFFINTVKEMPRNLRTRKADFYDLLSPRKGCSFSNEKLNALEGFVGYVGDIIAGYGLYSSLGKTPKTRLLTALKNRKKTGNSLGETF